MKQKSSRFFFIPLIITCSATVFSLSAEDQLFNEEGKKDTPIVRAEPADKTVPTEPLAQEPSNIATAGKITVIGGTAAIRGEITFSAENLRKDLGNLISDPKYAIKLPFFIKLHGKPGDKPPQRLIVSRIRQMDNQYQFLIDIHLARGIDRKALEYHLIEMMLYERGLNNGVELEDGERVNVKPWLIVGIQEAILLKRAGESRKIYDPELKHLEKIALQQAFDMTEKQWRALQGSEPMIFRAISGAMVSALLRQPKGKPSMASYIAEVATFQGEAENLMRKHFPSMNRSKNSLEKWINLELLELGTARIREVLSIANTEKRLEAALKLRITDELNTVSTLPLDAYQQVLTIVDEKLRADTVTYARAELMRLSYRSFPTYRPLIVEYDNILFDLARGKDDQIETRLKNLADSRIQQILAGERVRDYLDWWYITQSETLSSSFKSYMELVKKMESDTSSKEQKDSIEIYMDNFEKMFAPDDE